MFQVLHKTQESPFCLRLSLTKTADSFQVQFALAVRTDIMWVLNLNASPFILYARRTTIKATALPAILAILSSRASAFWVNSGTLTADHSRGRHAQAATQGFTIILSPVHAKNWTLSAKLPTWPPVLAWAATPATQSTPTQGPVWCQPRTTTVKISNPMAHAACVQVDTI